MLPNMIIEDGNSPSWNQVLPAAAVEMKHKYNGELASTHTHTHTHHKIPLHDNKGNGGKNIQSHTTSENNKSYTAYKLPTLLNKMLMLQTSLKNC